MSNSEVTKRKDYLDSFILMEWYADRNETIIIKSPDIIKNEMEHELEKLDDVSISYKSIEKFILILGTAVGQYSYITDFPIIMRNSFFVSCFSKFEIILTNICDSFRTEQNIDIAYTDLHGGGDIGKCYIYFKKVLKLDLKSGEELWQTMQKFNKIRNVIVHNKAKSFKPLENDIIQLIEKDQRLEITKDQELAILESDYIKEFIKCAHNYLEFIIKEYSRVYNINESKK